MILIPGDGMRNFFWVATPERQNHASHATGVVSVKVPRVPFLQPLVARLPIGTEAIPAALTVYVTLNDEHVNGCLVEVSVITVSTDVDEYVPVGDTVTADAGAGAIVMIATAAMKATSLYLFSMSSPFILAVPGGLSHQGRPTGGHGVTDIALSRK